MAIEATVLVVGKVIGERAGRTWLALRTDEADRNKELTELIKVSFRDQFAQRRLKRQLEDIADSVGERLLSLCAHEYQGLTDNDKTAVLLEVADILGKADLSDKGIFATDMDPRTLARKIQSGLSRQELSLSFGEAATRFMEVVLEDCCICLVAIIRELPQFNERAAIEMLSRLSGIGEQVGSVLTRLPARSLYAPDGSDADQEFRDLYLAHLSSSLDTIELFGVRVERYRPRTTLTVAYISLSVSSEDVVSEEDAGQDAETDIREQLKKHRETDRAAIRVETALGAKRLTLIRGEAGSGKSTLLRWLAINAARGRFTADLGDWNGSIPFLIKLRSYTNRELPKPENFIDGIGDSIAGLMPIGWVHRQLISGRVVLLIDGVDELPARQRRSIRTWLADILNAYPTIRVVVTSRPAAAGSDWLKAENFATAFLERMSLFDLRRLIHHWHEAARDCGDIPCPPQKLPSYEASLLARLENAPHLQTLATSPLLAAMLCALNLDRENQLPPSRMGLYRAALDLLLERRDAERAIPTEISLEADQKIRILQDLAWRLSVTGRAEISKSVAEKRVGEAIASMPRISGSAADILEYLIQRSGVVREPAVGRIDFVHRTVQEYLTAKQAADDGDMEALVAVAHRDQWHETIVMAAGHANSPLRHQLLTGILERIAREKRLARRLKLLLGACLETLPVIPPDLSGVIDQCLDDLIPPRDVTAARTLAAIGEPILTKIPASLAGLTEAAARATVRTAWMVNGHKALDLLSGYSKDSRESVLRELIQGWRFFNSDDYAARVLEGIPKNVIPIRVNAEMQYQALKNISKIESLDINAHADIPHAVDLGLIAKYSSSLRRLTINTDIPLQGLSVLREMQKLEYLTVIAPLDNIGFLHRVRELRYLQLDMLQGVEDWGPLLEQKTLTSLTLSTCGSLTELGALPPLGGIVTLSLSGSKLACDLSELVAAIPRVRSLRLAYSDWVNSLVSLESLPLRHLTLWGCEEVVDISPLAGQRYLTYLDLEDTGISDVTPLASMSRLNILWLRGCKEVHDLRPLAGLSKLRRIYLEGVAPGIDLAPISDNRNLIIQLASGQEVANRDMVRGHVQITGL